MWGVVEYITQSSFYILELSRRGRQWLYRASSHRVCAEAGRFLCHYTQGISCERTDSKRKGEFRRGFLHSRYIDYTEYAVSYEFLLNNRLMNTSESKATPLE